MPFFRNASFPVMGLGLGLVLALALIPVDSAFAHHGDPTSDLGYGAVSGDVLASAGVMKEFGHQGSVDILVAATYRGHEAHTSDHHVSYRYFWVTAQALIAPRADSLGTVIPSFSLNIVPVTKVSTSHEGVTRTVRYLPSQISRDVVAGIRGNVTVQAIGWSRYSEAPLVGEYSEHELARVVRFAQIAVDVVGLRFAGLSDQGIFVGGQLGSAQAQAGLAWNLDQKVSLRFALGARGNTGAGIETKATQFAAIAEGDVFARLQLLLNTAYAKLNVFVEGGYHHGQVFRLGETASVIPPHHVHAGEEHGVETKAPAPAHDNDEGPVSHAHPYILLGFGGVF